MSSVFHEGERAVQERAGVRDMARRVGNGIHAAVPPAAQEFLARQPFAVVGMQDAAEHLWASFVTGEPGFMRAGDAHTVSVNALPVPGDPLRAILAGAGAFVPHDIGLLAIEPATRRRMRVNGAATPQGESGFAVAVRQAYANCPKYIQARTIVSTEDAGNAPPAVWVGEFLTRAQQDWIARADTFFIATAHPEGGADVSHRGGNPGFVRLSSASSLIFPDYSGNAMFNTLGNLAVNPRAGLLFVDFTRGDTLQITGTAEILWDTENAALFPGAERVVALQVVRVVHITAATPLRGKLTSFSPFNP